MTELEPLLQYYLYCLEFSNGKKYLGLTKNIFSRCKSHRRAANGGSLLPVHKAIRKYGFPMLHVLCVGTKDYIADLEIKLIILWSTQTLGYNVAFGGQLSPAIVPEVAAKISAANQGRLKGYKHPPEFGAKISAAKIGSKLSPETIMKIKASKTGRSAYNKGKSFSAEARMNMSIAQRKRSPISDETRAKMSAVRIGVAKKPFSIEHRANIAAARTGRKCPEVAAANRRRRGLAKPHRGGGEKWLLKFSLS